VQSSEPADIEAVLVRFDQTLFDSDIHPARVQLDGTRQGAEQIAAQVIDAYRPGSLIKPKPACCTAPR